MKLFTRLHSFLSLISLRSEQDGSERIVNHRALIALGRADRFAMHDRRQHRASVLSAEEQAEIEAAGRYVRGLEEVA